MSNAVKNQHAGTLRGTIMLIILWSLIKVSAISSECTQFSLNLSSLNRTWWNSNSSLT